MASRYRSPVWDHFTISLSDDTKVVCNHCNSTFSRGGKEAKTFGTSNMFKHLRLQHPKEHDEVQAANKEKEKKEKLREQGISNSKVTLDTFVQKITPLGFNHPIAKRITRLVAEMIALDNQPFSIVDNTGFENLVHLLEPRYKLLSRRYFAEVAIPDIYKEVKDRVQDFLQHQQFVSCTTDL